MLPIPHPKTYDPRIDNSLYVVCNMRMTPVIFVRFLCLILLLGSCWISSPVMALPTGAEVTHGEVNTAINGNTLTIQQLTNTAITNWQSFSIDAAEVVNVLQPDEASALLNRVTGADPSQIMGQLNSNGRLFLINPNGLVVGKNATINAGEFIASALDISDEDFLKGSALRFSGDSDAGILNLGSISSSFGDLVLIASTVSNEGTLSAKQGTVALGAGQEILFSHENNQRLIVKADVTPRDGTGSNTVGVSNAGMIEAAEAALVAAGGDIYDLAINQSGIVKATGISEVNGRILLTAEGGSISLSGHLSADNQDGSGGDIQIGGSQRGQDTGIANAATTRVSDSATIDVSATEGDAGSVVVWSDSETHFAGNIDATAGTDGKGGFVEVSSKHDLNFTGYANLRAASGESGTLLLDPDALTIQAAGPGANILLTSALEAQLAAGNVVLDSARFEGGNPAKNGTITFNDAVSWTSNNSLELQASNNININANLSGGTADIIFGLGFLDPVNPGGPDAQLNVNAAATITAGKLTVGSNPNANIAASNSTDGPMGPINLLGILDVGTLDLKLTQPDHDPQSIDGNVTINNPANQIGRLENSGPANLIKGDFTLVDGGGGLAIKADFLVDGLISVSTTGDMTLESGTAFATSTLESNIYLAAQSGSFINNAGATSVTPNGAGRFLIYSDTPDNTTLGSLVSTPVYNKTFAGNAPGTITQTGNRILYSLAPTVVVTAGDKSREPNTANPALTFAVSGLVGGDIAGNVFSGTPNLTTTAVLGSPIGNYPINIVNGSIVLSDYDYGLSLVPGNLSIELDPLRELTVTADDMSRIYGDNNPDFTVGYTGFRVGDNSTIVSGLQFQTTAVPQSPVGTYSITPFGATAPNYSLTFVPGTLTVNVRDLTITADSATKTFGETLSPLGIQTSGLASFDTLAALGTVTTTTSGLSKLSNVGTYPVIASGATNANYNVTYVAGSIVISPAPLTAVASDKSRIYGDANPAFSISLSGLISGDSVDTSSIIYTTSADPTSSIGLYSITPSGLVDPNYDITFVPGKLEIFAADLSVTANPFTRTYGDENPALTYSIAGLKLTDTLGDVLSDLSVSTTATAASSVGTYAITPTGTTINPNYSVTFNNANATITKANLDLFLQLSQQVYGEPIPSPEIVAFGLVNGDTTAVVKSRFIDVLAPTNPPVGTYIVQFLGANANNYNITSLNGSTLTITPRPLTIKTDDSTREYGEPNPDFTATMTGLASFDTPSVITNLAFDTPATASSNALNYGVNVTSDPNPNYSIAYKQGIMSVTPAPLKIEVSDTFGVYGRGRDDFSLDAFIGLKLDDDQNSIGLSITSPAGFAADAGTYPITASITSRNYSLDVTDGVLEILKAPLTVRTTNQAKVYGESNPALPEFTVGGLAFADRKDIIKIINPTDETTMVGQYNFEFNDTSGNYFFSGITGGLFTILQRKIAIKPKNVVRIYGDKDPEFEYLVAGDGLASFDTIDDVVLRSNLTFSGSFGQRADVGSRTMRAALAGNPNYVIANRQGYYVILPRPVTFVVNDAEAIGNFPLPEFSATVTNLPDFETQESAFPTLVFQVFRTDVDGPVQMVTSPEDFEVPASFSDTAFLAKFPSTITAPDAEFDSSISTITPIPIEDIDFEGGNDENPGIIISSFKIPLPSSKLFTTEEQETKEPVIQYIQARGTNPNYAVVARTNGKLVWSPDPAVAARNKAIDAERAKYDAVRDGFFNPSAIGDGRGTLLGLPAGAQQTILDSLGQALGRGDETSEQLQGLISAYGAKKRGTAEFKYLTGGAYSDFDTLAFLEAARTDPIASELLGKIYATYLTNLVSSPGAKTEAQTLVLNQLSIHAAEARDAMSRQMESKYEAWQNDPTTQAAYSSMTGLFGVDVPYADFMGEAAGDFVGATVGVAIAGGAVAIGGGVAAATAIAGATTAILPYALHGATVATIAAGGTVGGSAAATAAVVAGPAAIIGVAIAGSIARGVQVFNTAAQEKVYQGWIDSRGTPLDVTTLTLTDKKGDPNPVDNAILLGAIATMLGGGS